MHFAHCRKELEDRFKQALATQEAMEKQIESQGGQTQACLDRMSQVLKAQAVVAQETQEQAMRSLGQQALAVQSLAAQQVMAGRPDAGTRNQGADGLAGVGAKQDQETATQANEDEDAKHPRPLVLPRLLV